MRATFTNELIKLALGYWKLFDTELLRNEACKLPDIDGHVFHAARTIYARFLLPELIALPSVDESTAICDGAPFCLFPQNNDQACVLGTTLTPVGRSSCRRPLVTTRNST